MKQQNLQFPQAIEVLAERAHISLPKTDFEKNQDFSKKERDLIYQANEFAKNYFHEILLRGKEAENARKYLTEKRKISKDIISRFQLGYAKSDWEGLLNKASQNGFSNQILLKAGLILPRQSGGTGYYDRFREQIIYPIKDYQGRVTGFGGRFLDNREPKYLNSPETVVFSKSRSLYALPQAIQEIREQQFAIFVEGYMDALRMHQSGIQNTVATLGTALTAEQAKLLKRYCSDVILMYDTDKAGIQAALRGLEPLVSMGLSVKVVTLPSGKDPDEFLQEKGKEDFYKELAKARTPVEFALDLIVEQYGLKSIPAKANVVSAMLPFLDRVSQPAERELYLRTIAERVGLDKESVFSQYKLTKKNRQNGTPSAVDGFASLEKGRIHLERDLLRLMLFYPHFIPNARQIIQLIDFTDEVHRKIAQTVFEMKEDILSKNIVQWLNYFEDEAAVQLITQLLIDEKSVQDPEATFQGYLRKFEQQKIKLAQHELKEKIKQAMESGNQNLLKDLQNQFIQLQKSTLTPVKAG